MLSPQELYAKRMFECEVLSRVALEIGNLGQDYKNVTEDIVFKYWNKEEIMPIFRKISVGNVKWYIRDKLEWEHPIWNGSFLKGMTRVGHVQNCPQSFPRFHWSACPHIWDMIDNCPFGGKKYKAPNNMQPHYWNSVPALCLPGKEDSIHYVAGLMSALERIDNINGLTYARISSPLFPHIKKLGIPIDHRTNSDMGNGISPIWPMLFKKYMPEENTQWENIKNPLLGDIYAMILWKTYVSNNFESKGLPFLPSRRTIYYRWKVEQKENGIRFWRGRQMGALRWIDKMRLDYHITNLNPHVIQMVREYAKNELTD